jgi:hypothetical protein
MTRDAHWADLGRTQRRRRVVATVAHVVVAWVIALGAYAVLPLAGGDPDRTTVGLVGGVLLVVALVLWEVWRIVDSGVPALRAAQALGTILAVFLVTFAGAYLAMAHADPSRFNVPLDHVSALYFATTVFATVGFGDISARGDLAQIVVTAQMLLDLVLIGLVVRVVLAAAKLGQQKRDAARRQREAS